MNGITFVNDQPLVRTAPTLPPLKKSTFGITHNMVIVRHGTTNLNGDGKERGWRDVPLSEKGVSEAERTAAKLAKENLDVIVTSDLKRAVRTAKIIAKVAGVPQLCSNHTLRAWNIGKLAGKDEKDVLPILKEAVFKTPQIPLPGGESFNMFKQRFLGGIQEIKSKYLGDKVALVTHKSGERLLNAWVKGGEQKDFSIKPNLYFQEGVPAGGFTVQNI